MELVVVEQSLTVSVVILHENILILITAQSVGKFENCIVVEIPSASFGEDDAPAPATVVREHCRAYLINTAVLQNVFVVDAVDYRNPELTVNHEVGVDNDIGSKRYTVP